MNIFDIDIILKELSSKFNKIFCDREFVCCIQEDIDIILRNRDRCCVVVFPLLGSNYLKAVQYQAKIFNLEVFTLGSKKICSIAVCDKKFLIKKPKESEERMMPNNEEECGSGSTLKKKRPERQLYVPPAQRRLPANELPQHNNSKNDQGNRIKPKKSPKKWESQKKINLEIPKLQSDTLEKLNNDCIKETVESNNYEITENYSFMWWKYALFEPLHRNYVSSRLSWNFKELMCNINFDDSKIFGIRRNLNPLYILDNHYVLWQPKSNFFINEEGTTFNVKSIPPDNLNVFKNEVEVYRKDSLMEVFLPQKTYLEILENFKIYCDFDVYWLRKKMTPYNFLDMYCRFYYYLIQEEIFTQSKMEKVINDLLFIGNGLEKIETKNMQEEKINKPINPALTEQSIPTELNLGENINNDNSNKLNYLNNTVNVSENVKKHKNDLEEEKEIMRKTKENINRKTRPIIKYVDEANDTLQIDQNDVNTWEDLFDEEGQLQDDLLKQIVYKVGNDVTIIKAKEDYSDYFSKHINIEELEHMVELYDFPATLETHDLIHAFSEIKSDAMYIKWVDDTHAILVLGSSSQAQKAISVQNPLIKVRPMIAASKISLSAAYRNDLKPAMKRPPTNLQTARRLITSHLGTKSGISKERNAKERDDLNAAREMKKLVKKNEQDAWEGNLRSSLS